MKHKVIPYTEQINPAVDLNDPDAAITAVELRFPDTFSARARRVIRYMEGAMFLYSYKGKFVVTDESLCLSIYGNGTREAPFAGPRWVGGSLERLEQWLESIADDYDEAGDIPGWEIKPKRTIPHSESLGSTLVTLSSDKNFVGIKTYDRQHGRHGRFLINHLTLLKMLEEPEGLTQYEEDCGDYVKITRTGDSLHFSFAWLNYHGDGSVKGFRQDIKVPISKIWLVLDWTKTVRHLYVPKAPQATIDARPAALVIREIARDKRIKRAFSKAMRDCFQWPGDHVTLYPDGKYSFYFITKSGFPKNGGLILHESTKDGYPYIYYSVHT